MGKAETVVKGGKNVPAFIYILLYNVVMIAYWGSVASVTWPLAMTMWKNPQSTPPDVWEAAGHMTRIAVGVAFLEVLHAAVKLAKGSPITAAIQNFGRAHCIFGIVALFPQSLYRPGLFGLQGQAWVAILFLTWAASELIRYPFYVTSDLGICPGFLVWLRYSAFLVLYPIGFGAEMALYIQALPEIKAWGQASTNGFYFYCWVLFGLFVLYPVLGPTLYYYMLKQRRSRRKAGLKLKKEMSVKKE